MRHDNFIAKDTLNEEVLENALRRLPAGVPPAGLTTSLRVIASRERQRRLQRYDWRRSLASWYERTCMLMNDVMRPLALPFAGGVASAVVLFSAWLVPTYPLRARTGGSDIPTMLTTQATLKGAVPASASSGEMAVDVTVDGEGRMVDYDIVGDGDAIQDANVRRRLESFLYFNEFVPATAFGRPVAGTVRVPIYAIQAQGVLTWAKAAMFVIVKD
ncbi:MAG TPA: hypothetical protein VGN17_27270 [Bryobacteraceae bacterium]|jgi:hypothetical protein